MLAPAALVTAIVVVLGFMMAPGNPAQQTRGAEESSAPDGGQAMVDGSRAPAKAASATPSPEGAPPVTKRAELRNARLLLTAPRTVLDLKPKPKFRTIPGFSFTIATFNVLGHSHTVKGGNKSRYASSATRMGWTVASLNGHGIEVVGLQEFQTPQFHNFNGRTGGSWDVWPGMAAGRDGVANSVAWRRGTFTAVSKHTIPIPYFGGRRRPMPYVQLQHNETGRRIWVANFHNPTSNKNHGNNYRWRRVATSLQIGLANRLGADGTPVFFTGDFNERAEFFCPFTMNTGLKAANGGSTGSPCQPPGSMQVDWVFGSDAVAFSNYRVDRSAHIQRTTDHPLVAAEASVSGYRERIRR